MENLIILLHLVPIEMIDLQWRILLIFVRFMSLYADLYICSMFICRDLQSYLSHLSLFLAPESNKFYVLVDNRPWEVVSRPAHFWQLMITKVIK